MLRAIGLDALIAADETRYLEIASELAQDPIRLDRLRADLRPRLKAASLMDGAARARQLERVYRALSRRRTER